MAKQTDNDPRADKSGRQRTILWLCAVFFVSAWMFILGVLVGRGTAPVHFDVEALQKELAALKESVKIKEKPWYRNRSEPDRQTAELEFHEALKKDKIESQLAMGAGRTVKQPVRPQKSEVSAKPKPSVGKASGPTGAPARPPEKSGAAGTGGFAVQVAALKDAGSAEAKAAEFSRKGYPAYSTSATVAGRGTWYRVRIGNFGSRAEALQILEKLKKENIKGFIVKKE